MSSGLHMDVETADQKLSELAELKWRWLRAGQSAPLGRQLLDWLNALPDDFPAEHRNFSESVRRAVDGSSANRAKSPAHQASPPAWSNWLPVRNQWHTDAAHVKLFQNHNGLIHGGIVRIGSGTLECRAYRTFETITRRLQHGKGSTFEVTEVIGGTCTVRNAAGTIVGTWSVAPGLREFYNAAKPAPPVQDGRAAFAEPNYRRVYGFYRAGQKKGSDDIFDTGRPSFIVHMHDGKTVTDVDDVRYVQWPVSTDGFVIDTPYVSVFSPSPDFRNPIVQMIGSYRSRKAKEVRRRADWYTKSFPLP